MSARGLLLAALLSGGCLGGPRDRDTQEPGDIEFGWADSGALEICLAGPPDDAWGPWDVKGRVVGSGTPPEDCNLYGWSTPSRVLEIVDADGATWSLGWSIRNVRGEDFTPDFDVVEGQEVRLRFEAQRSFSFTTAQLLLTDDDGIVAGAANGSASPVPGLEVEKGEVTAQMRGVCGLDQERALVFVGDERVTIEPFGVGAVRVDGARLSVVASAAVQVIENECLDSSGGWTSWAVHR